MALSPEYFRDLIKEHTNALRANSKIWIEELSLQSSLSDDIIGDINVATGQTELLIQERFSQFENLICDYELKRGEKETTLQDLQGFWDIVFIQVENIKTNFGKLAELKKNNWVYPSKSLPIKPSNSALLKRKPLSTIQNQKCKSNGSSSTKSSIRDHILAARKKMKVDPHKDVSNVEEGIKNMEVSAAEKENKNSLQEKVSNKTTLEDNEETKNFNAGFFRVETPIKNNSGKPRKKREEVMVTSGSTPKVLSSTALKNQLKNTPIVHKDYSPFMRVTRSMKKILMPVQLNEVDN